MAVKKAGLGKGLDSLIIKKDEGIVLDNKTDVQNFPTKVDINKVEPNKNQPRKNFDEDKLQELADSINIHGIIEPLIVQDRGDFYEIIGGERRWRAARMAGLTEVPVIIMNLSEREFVEISIIDNIQREALNPIEEALAYKRLIEEFDLKQDEVAERVSKSRAAVTNSLRLLKLDNKVQQMVIDEKITTGHARAILGINDLNQQYDFAQKVFDEKLSVRDVEREVKKLQSDKKESKSAKQGIDDRLVAIYSDLEEKLKSILGTKVIISTKNNKTGKIEIEYYNQDELDRLVEMLQSLK